MFFLTSWPWETRGIGRDVRPCAGPSTRGLAGSRPMRGYVHCSGEGKEELAFRVV